MPITSRGFIRDYAIRAIARGTARRDIAMMPNGFDERDKWIEHAIRSDMTEEERAKFLQLQYAELHAQRAVSLPNGSVLQAVYLLLAERTILIDRHIRQAIPDGREAEVAAALEALRAKDWLEKRTMQGVIAWRLKAPANYAAMTMQEAERKARER